jgi:large conductance mechanosensitive channel
MNKKVPVPVEIIDGFFRFIQKYKVIGLALGVVIGGAVNKLVASFVDNIINPAIGLLLGTREGLGSITLGPVRVGAFTNSLLDFLIVMFIVYIAITYVIRHFSQEEDEKK